MFPRGKSILAGLLILALPLVVSGCGTASAAAASTAPTKAALSDKVLSTDQVKKLDPKSSQDQAEIDRQIDKNLQSLDASLNALDKSLGSL